MVCVDPRVLTMPRRTFQNITLINGVYLVQKVQKSTWRGEVIILRKARLSTAHQRRCHRISFWLIGQICQGDYPHILLYPRDCDWRATLDDVSKWRFASCRRPNSASSLISRYTS